jgi:hypothetical protein
MDPDANFDIEKLENFLPLKLSKVTTEHGTIVAMFDDPHDEEFPGKYIIIIAPEKDIKTEDRVIRKADSFDELKDLVQEFLNAEWQYCPPPEQKLTNEDGTPLTGKQKKKLKRHIQREVKKEKRRINKRKNKRKK